jgi:hypothetical protein
MLGHEHSHGADVHTFHFICCVTPALDYVVHRPIGRKGIGHARISTSIICAFESNGCDLFKFRSTEKGDVHFF